MKRWWWKWFVFNSIIITQKYHVEKGKRCQIVSSQWKITNQQGEPIIFDFWLVGFLEKTTRSKHESITRHSSNPRKQCPVFCCGKEKWIRTVTPIHTVPKKTKSNINENLFSRLMNEKTLSKGSILFHKAWPYWLVQALWMSIFPIKDVLF